VVPELVEGPNTIYLYKRSFITRTEVRNAGVRAIDASFRWFS